MKLNQETFFEVLRLLQEQQDKDNSHADSLSTIYKTGIDPADNSSLTNAIILLLSEVFNDDQIEEIVFFCYDQDFGRKAKLTPADLWQKLINEIEVEGAVIVKTCNSCINNQCICNN